MTYDPMMLLDAYRRMRAIREFEERMRREVQAGTVPGFVHLYCGQEAVAVGACMNLLDSDYIGSTHRGHGHCIAKGCDIGGDAARDLLQAGRALQRQGRLDAHRRPAQGHARRQRDRRRARHRSRSALR